MHDSISEITRKPDLFAIKDHLALSEKKRRQKNRELFKNKAGCVTSEDF